MVGGRQGVASALTSGEGHLTVQARELVFRQQQRVRGPVRPHCQGSKRRERRPAKREDALPAQTLLSDPDVSYNCSVCTGCASQWLSGPTARPCSTGAPVSLMC